MLFGARMAMFSSLNDASAVAKRSGGNAPRESRSIQVPPISNLSSKIFNAATFVLGIGEPPPRREVGINIPGGGVKFARLSSGQTAYTSAAFASLTFAVRNNTNQPVPVARKKKAKAAI